MNTKSLLAASALLLMALPGCGLIFGGDQRVDNKSHDYTVVRLDNEKPREWHRLAPDALDRAQNGSSGPSSAIDSSPASPDDTGDLAFEHRETGAIISVDSVCREYREASLDELTHYLLLGLKTEGPVLTQPTQIDGVSALESTVDASMSQRAPSDQNSRPPSGGRRLDEQPVRVKAVVLRKSGCTYDLMFVARPTVFEQLEPTFDRFLKGFHAH